MYISQNDTKTNSDKVRKTISRKSANSKPKKSPMYILTVEWDEGKSVNLEVYSHSKPQEIAYNFCKKYNLAFCSMEILTEQIKSLLINNTNGDNTENNTKTNINQQNTNDYENLQSNNNIDEERKSIIMNKGNQCLSETKCLFNPSEFMFKRIIESQRSSKKFTQENIQPFTSSQIKRNKLKEIKKKKISLFTIEDNEKKLKEFLSNNTHFTEILYQKSKLKHFTDGNHIEDITIINTGNISSPRMISEIENSSNASLFTNNHYDNQRKKNRFSSTCEKRSYSLLNNQDKNRNHLSHPSNEYFLDKLSYHPIQSHQMTIHNNKRQKSSQIL